MSAEESENTEVGETTDAGSLTCFVIGPIGNRLAPHASPERATYEEAIRVVGEVIGPACDAVGLSPVRADSLSRAGEITEQIFRRIRDDDVVIADLTGANANVMYELGLRHTRDKLTVQIGEYGRLPFDVNVIRTVQFSRSEIGLINARNELTKILRAGIDGDFDPVTATRVWGQTRSEESPLPDDETDQGGGLAAAGGETGPQKPPPDDRGFVDILAEAEERQEQLPGLMEGIGAHIEALGSLADASTLEMHKADAAGKGMRGRLALVAKYAAGLDRIAGELEKDVETYVEVLASESEGNLALIERLEEEPHLVHEEPGQEFGTAVRGLAVVTRNSLASLAGMVETINENARLSRLLKSPTRRLTVALDQFVEATSVVDEWDRRLQSLGVEAPAVDSEGQPITESQGDSPAEVEEPAREVEP